MGDLTFQKEVGRNLQSCRKAAGFKSAEAFAEHIGMKVSAYTEYEQGRRAFNYEQAWLMADALRCTMDELGGRDWPPGGTPQLDADEASVVASMRLMDGEQRGKYRDLAPTFVVASEKDGPGDRADGSGAALAAARVTA